MSHKHMFANINFYQIIHIETIEHLYTNITLKTLQA